MSNRIKNKVSSYYTSKLKEFGTTPRGVDWNSPASQAIRFEQLVKILPHNPDLPFSVLDYGCGYGALYTYLFSKYPNMNFTGFDISPEMIEECKKLHGETVAKWYYEDNHLIAVDYVIASGIFNVCMEFSKDVWFSYILKTLNKINSLATKGFSFNILTAYSDKEHIKENLFYAEPSILFDYCKTNFSKYVALLHDYPLYEFSILVKK